MSWVDTLGDVEWSRADLQNRMRNELARDFPDAAELQLRVGQLATRTGLMTTAEQARWDAYLAAEGALRQQVESEWVRSQLVTRCKAVEAALRTLRDFPALPEGDGGHAERETLRADAQGFIDAQTTEVATEVAQRNRVPAPEEAA